MFEVATYSDGVIMLNGAVADRVFQLLGDCVFMFSAFFVLLVLLLGVLAFIAFRLR